MGPIGYEKEKVEYDLMPPGPDGKIKPPEFFAYRIKKGRRTDRGGPFPTVAGADQWIESQRQLDQDDKFRDTGRWTKE